tara:strand:+ start:1510 stop:1656 length:147 start_codon:yes stop_codon:yes gene_type:complete
MTPSFKDEDKKEPTPSFKEVLADLFKDKHQDQEWVDKLKALIRKHYEI